MIDFSLIEFPPVVGRDAPSWRFGIEYNDDARCRTSRAMPATTPSLR